MGFLSTLSISGPIHNFAAVIRWDSFSCCHLHSLDNFCCTLDFLYKLSTSNRGTRVAKKQAWNCHTFIWPYKWSRECWSTTRIPRWIISIWAVQWTTTLSAYAAISHTTENHNPSAIIMCNQPADVSDYQLCKSLRSLKKLTTGAFMD